MEDMHTRKFTSCWKTWTGARMLCMRMPPSLTVSRRVNGTLNFEYVLIAKIREMMTDAAAALNVLNYLKPKVCAYMGAYRRVPFEANKQLCSSLGISDVDLPKTVTNRLRVSYSNHTAYVQLSHNVEFRCEETHIKVPPMKICTGVQTDLSVINNNRRPRRSLPRRDSLNGNSENRSELFTVTTSVSPRSCEPHSNTKFVTVGEHYMLILDASALEDEKYAKHATAGKEGTEIEQNDRESEVEKEEVPDSLLPAPLLPLVPKDDGALLRKLKTRYFNSPEYTAAELCNPSPT
ncbi:unnamed protein product [Caenorhabditis auriculariae]|uniref:DUF7153 domain-containing protein n=1 Tax=Caenorhabditis auriculariae TaxID=2777116 RepID=A0A8S1H5E7_9PELO|nr:unnamed protein product [Caenorhabditis auriculariae]